MRLFYGFLAGLFLHAATVSTSGAAIVVSSDGSDGAFNPTGNVEIDLGLAATAAWNTPSPVAGQGVYDSTKWAVVFKYSSVNIPDGVIVTFKNHPSNPPVVWLVSGNAIIGGSIRLDGTNSAGLPPTTPGPGGFRGGRTRPNSDGFGPHGGVMPSNRHAVFDYGNSRILPLIGGSGGAGGGSKSLTGGAGGGAILIAASDSIRVNGQVSAIQGYGAPGFSETGNGSGGAIRLIADVVTGPGQLTAAIAGRIRVEANTIVLDNPGDPVAALGVVGPAAEIWPATSAPKITPVSLGGVPIPPDPTSAYTYPNTDVTFSTNLPVTLVLQGTNLPTASTVSVILIPRAGARTTVPASIVSGDLTSSTWEATINIAGGFTAIQARAILP